MDARDACPICAANGDTHRAFGDGLDRQIWHSDARWARLNPDLRLHHSGGSEMSLGIFNCPVSPAGSRADALASPGACCRTNWPLGAVTPWAHPGRHGPARPHHARSLGPPRTPWPTRAVLVPKRWLRLISPSNPSTGLCRFERRRRAPYQLHERLLARWVLPQGVRLVQ
jgi:hypothetical protein